MNRDEFVIDQSVDQFFESLPLGSVSRAISNNLYGINFKQSGNAVPKNKDMYGYTFFTRPQLNLTNGNITNFRSFHSLANSKARSYQRYTRLMLDPKLGAVFGLKSPLVHNECAFIPLLSNNILSLSGWPDMSIPTHTSQAGLYGQEQSIVDGVVNHYESYDIDCTFRNMRGNLLIYFFYIWVKYQTLVYESVLNPYACMITENEIDYNTRIYRLIMDQSKKYVTQLMSTGASFPVNVPIGSLGDYSSDVPFNLKNSEINIRFKSDGFIVFDDALKWDFNETVAIFSPDMRKVFKHDTTNLTKDIIARDDGKTQVYTVPGCGYVKLTHSSLMYNAMYSLGGGDIDLNHYAIPYINFATNELEWWVDSRIVNSLTKALEERRKKSREREQERIKSRKDMLDKAKALMDTKTPAKKKI